MVRAGLCVLALLATTAAAAAQTLSPIQAQNAQNHYRAGLELMSAERWDRAADEFQAAIAIDPLMAWAHYNLGQCRMAKRRFVEAGISYEKARETFEELARRFEQARADREIARRDEINEINDSLKRQINISAITRSAMEERVRTLDSAANRDLDVHVPVPAELYLALGSAYFRQEKLGPAEQAYTEAVRVNPKLGAAHNNLAVIYMLGGRFDEADAALSRATQCGFRVDPQLRADIRDAKRRATRD
jgi:tetratricopeptide (TPR) repeat protein